MNSLAEDEPLVASRESAVALAAAITATLTELGETLATESTLIRRGDLDGAAALLPEKERLSQAYQLAMARTRRNGLALARLDPEGLQRLRGAHHELRAIIEENLKRLAAARDAAEELIRSAAKGAGVAQAPSVYGRAGERPQAPPVWRGIAVNRSL